MDNNDNEFKVIFVGDSGTGAKTCLIERILYGRFNPNTQSTFSCSFVTKYATNYLGKKIILNLWDTTGQEKFRALTKIFLKDSNCVVLGYSIDHEYSFDAVEFYYETVKEMLGDFPLIYLVVKKN